MDRRKTIKVIASLGALTLLPSIDLINTSQKSNIHFVGLGGGGCNALEYIYRKGIKALYTCVTSPERQHLPSDINFILFDSPEKYFLSKNWYCEKLILPTEIEAVFKDNCYYYMLVGLGGYTGTMLINKLYPYLKARDKEFTIICSYPFRFEGKKRMEIANTKTKDIQNSVYFMSFKLEDLREMYGDMTLKEAFKKADEQYYKNFTQIS